MRITLLLFIVILVSSKAFKEDKVQKEELDDLDLFMSFPSFKPSMPSFKPSMPSFKPTTFKPSMPSFKPTTFKPTIFKPTTFKPTTFKPTTFKPTTFKPKTSTFKPTINTGNNFRTNLKNKINGAYNGLNKLPNSLPVINPLNNRKDFKVGKNLKFGVENDFHNAKVDGSYTRTKNLGPGMKRDTKYSGSIGAKFEDGKKGLSGSFGKTTTNYRGPFYTQKGNKHSLSVDALHKNGNRGIEGSYTNTKSNGRGMKLGKGDISNIRSNERKFTVGGGVNQNGRRYGNIGYQNKRTNTQSLSYGNNKISRSDYTARGHQISGGYRKTRNGREIDGSYTRNKINGQSYTIGKTTLTRENERGNTYGGKVNFGRHGGSVSGNLGRYNQQTYKGKVGAVEASYSRKNYRNIEGGVKGSYRNGVFKGGIRGSYTNGQTHTGKIGDAKVTVGRENKYSGNIGITAGKHGVGLNAHGQRSTKYSGGFSAGKLNGKGSVTQSQFAGGSARFKRNGFNIKGNYGQKYSGQGNLNIGRNKVGVKGHFSEKTYGGVGGRINRNGGSVHGNIGRQYTAGGQVNVNGRKVGANGKLNGQVNGKLGFNKRTGLSAQVGGRGQAHLGAQVGRTKAQINVSSDLRVKVGMNKGIPRVNIKGGIHGGINIKNGNGRTMHIGKQTIKNGLNNIKRGFNSFTHRVTRSFNSPATRSFGGSSRGRVKSMHKSASHNHSRR